MIAGKAERRQIRGRTHPGEFFFHLPPKFGGKPQIGRVRPSRRQREVGSGIGMLTNEGAGRGRDKAGGNGDIRKLQQGIFVSPVAVDGQEYGGCAAAGKVRESVRRDRREAAAVDGSGQDDGTAVESNRLGRPDFRFGTIQNCGGPAAKA